MLKENVQAALNNQLNSELYASYFYLSMSAYFHAINLSGFASWIRTQAQEELVHALKVYDFINDREGEVALTTIAEPKRQWENTLAAFEDAYRHEKAVTAQIYDLVDLSVKERDHATNTFLQWFVTEQVEEEATANDIVNKLKLVGNDGNGLFILDRDLGTRGPKPKEDE